MPYTAQSNSVITVDFGAALGGAAYASNVTNGFHQPDITLTGIQQAMAQIGAQYQQAQSGLWNQLLGSSAGLGQYVTQWNVITSSAASPNTIYYVPATAYPAYGSVVTGSWATNAAYVETPEQRVAREEYAVRRVVAESRAEQLLFTMLSKEQIAQYKERGYFETSVDDRVYRIKKGRAGNVERIENGKPVMRLCAHPRDWTPSGDAMLAQLLMLKTDEARFLATANKTRLYL